MSQNYQSGHDKLGYVKLGPAGNFYLLTATTMELDENTALNVVRNASLGGRTARLPGFGDSKGTCTADFDLDQPPYAYGNSAGLPNILSGLGGVYQGYFSNVSLAQFVSIGIRVGRVHYAIPAEGKITYSFDWEEDVLSGPIVFPLGVDLSTVQSQQHT